mgnify:CR=1 FL=1
MPFPRYFNPFAIFTLGGVLVQFANGRGLNVRCTIERTLEPEPDRCDLAIEGLDPIKARTIGAVFRELPTSPTNIVQVQLGYDAIPQNAFVGRMESYPDSTRKGPTFWTYATAGDGADAYDTDKLVPAVSTAGLTAENMIDVALAVLPTIQRSPTVSAVIAGAAPLAQGPFSASGVRTATDLLDEAARLLRCRWFIRDSLLHLVRNGLPTPEPAIIIAPDQPGPRFPGVPLVEPVAFGGGGLMQCVTFLDPGIVPGRQVSYQGGRFRVEHVVHSLETRSPAPWVSRIVGRAL